MRNLLYTLGLGAAALIISGCESPLDDTFKRVEVPAECAKVRSLVESHGPTWSLTCEGKNGEEIFYKRTDQDEFWKKYDIVRR